MAMRPVVGSVMRERILRRVRLAGAVAADDAEDLALFYLEADILEGPEFLAVELGLPPEPPPQQPQAVVHGVADGLLFGEVTNYVFFRYVFSADYYGRRHGWEDVGDLRDGRDREDRRDLENWEDSGELGDLRDGRTRERLGLIC
jgi:hypothetical protein